ncbi:MAG: hypothetical protein LBG86_01000 [Puniceicoccales bacterium]|nr:hypothetical protein [Puniceicoccales bacterium]
MLRFQLASVHVIAGEERNIKMTHGDDINLAACLCGGQ